MLSLRLCLCMVYRNRSIYIGGLQSCLRKPLPLQSRISISPGIPCYSLLCARSIREAYTAATCTAVLCPWLLPVALFSFSGMLLNVDRTYTHICFSCIVFRQTLRLTMPASLYVYRTYPGCIVGFAAIYCDASAVPGNSVPDYG